jgi:hypothetical protein
MYTFNDVLWTTAKLWRLEMTGNRWSPQGAYYSQKIANGPQQWSNGNQDGNHFAAYHEFGLSGSP